MAKKARKSQQLDFAFYTYLRDFYVENRGLIRKHYRNLTKKFLDFNDTENPMSFLRTPQFEALEIYIFLKEFLDNSHVHKIFEDWFKNKGKFVNANKFGTGPNDQMSLFLDEESYNITFKNMKSFAQNYPNYIFALTMGTGKTILMATCIFYEFLLANKFPKDEKYVHNALVFAPDKTVLESLKEIQTFDKRKVVPPEYVNVLNTQLKIHFLEDSGSTLNTIDKSRFNIIISNTQKVILKRKHKEKSNADLLFENSTFETGSIYDEINKELYDFNSIDDEGDLIVNQRFLKLTHLQQLGIYVDEAHHAFGNTLAKDMGLRNGKTSLKLTINELSNSLESMGTRVVGCYNYTGTPYIGNEILPEVVYAYNLKTAITNEYLKEVNLHGYTNPKNSEFVRFVVNDFWEKYKGKRYEGMLPKFAFFASTIEELENELRPAVEEVLNNLGIPLSKILVNVGDPKFTTNDDIREFNKLDTPGSDKQFILLVNKGREGWNCRSLFGVGLYRRPKSRIFVLQATMRCLRSIGPIQETANVYLSDENLTILDDELQQNFRVSAEELQNQKNDKKTYEVKVVPPPVRIPVKRVRKLYLHKDKVDTEGIDLKLDEVDEDKYKLIHTEQEGLISSKSKSKTEDLSELREKRIYSSLTLVAEISRYLNRSCLEIETILKQSVQGIEGILNIVNKYNEVLYDWVIPQLYNSMVEVDEFEKHEEEKLELVKEPKEGYYLLKANEQLVAGNADEKYFKYLDKTFHLDTYCFDSIPERQFFDEVLDSEEVKEIYFTGMLTHGQSDFYIQYVDPDSHSVRSYYPDFLIKKSDGTWIVVEVKGDNKFEDPVVLAKKKSANEMALASKMTYKMLKSSEIVAGYSQKLIE